MRLLGLIKMSWEGHSVVMGRTGSGKSYFAMNNLLPLRFNSMPVLFWNGGHDLINIKLPVLRVTGLDNMFDVEKAIYNHSHIVCYEPDIRQVVADKELKIWQERLMRGPRKNLTIFIDEAQRYAPQGSIDTGAHLLATGGRKHGISCIFITQRVAELSKTIATQCRTWVIFEHSQIDTDYLRGRGLSLTDEELKLLSKKYSHIKKEL